MTELLTWTETDGVALVTLQRPPVNALNRALQEELRHMAKEVTEDAAVRSVVIYGGERTFAAGADIKEMRTMSYTDMVDASAQLQSAFTAVAKIPKPTFAAISGYALGAGFELALCCDFRVGAQSCKVGQPEVLLGLIPGAGGTQRLARLVGPAWAKHLCFTGEVVGAKLAQQAGLLCWIEPDDQLLDATVQRAQKFTALPPYALRAAKEAIDRGMETDLDTGLEIERLQFAGLFATEDRTIGMESFVQDGPGKAQFVGK